MTKHGRKFSASPPAAREASPLQPERRKRRADRIGGSQRLPAGTEPSDEFPAAATAAELRDLGTRLIADMLAGRINPRTAAGLVPLMNLQPRAVEGRKFGNAAEQTGTGGPYTRQSHSRKRFEEGS